ILAGFHRDVTNYFPYLDLFALSSNTEGLPVVLLEAFTAGLPVLATAVGGVPEIVADARNGRLVTAGDAKALARRLVELAQDPATRTSYGANGRVTVRNQFSVKHQSEQYRGLFEAIVGQRSRKRSRRRLREPVLMME